MSLLLMSSPCCSAGHRPPRGDGATLPAIHDDRVHASPPALPSGAVLSPEVSDALSAGRPVVALESTLLAHGLPRPDNRAAADEVERAVRAGGAVPSTSPPT